ncbi:hypothetical protein AA313_de0200711 [Arthrobotrys entomopaga]|nr:hypothetical protein AA313_de0200711 [Arthrobotrys entomopaga]
MFVLKGLVAGLVLGLAQTTLALQGCCNDKCGKPVGLAKYGRHDCSSRLIKYTTPTKTRTVYRTSTHTVASTVVKKVTGTKDVTVTTVLSVTDHSVTTDLSTVTDTDVQTAVSTDFDTVLSTITVPFVVSTAAVPKRDHIDARELPRPAYAHACNSDQYTRACSCLGVKPRTITRPAVYKTIYKTRTTVRTVLKTVTSHAATKTITHILSRTVHTTIVAGTTIVETDLATITTTIETAITTVSIATVTADPAPPTCTGTGFYLQIVNTSKVSGYLGFINSIGQGIYLRVFTGGGSPLEVDGSGNIVSYYSPEDIKMLVLDSGPPPYQLWFSSDAANVHYTVKNDPVSCQLGGAPDYAVSCKGPDGSPYSFAVCLDPVYFEWNAWIYVQGQESSLDGRNCITGNTIMGVCR